MCGDALDEGIIQGDWKEAGRPDLGDILEAAGLGIVGVTIFDPESLQVSRPGSATNDLAPTRVSHCNSTTYPA